MAAQRPIAVVITCEHAGNRVPPRYARLFRGREQLLASHRGWDPGALELARSLSRSLGAPLLFTNVTRLLVEANRSAHHPALFSAITRSLPREEKDRILRLYCTPHRDRVRSMIAERIEQGRRVLHLGVHTFTPELDGVRRNADVGLLYDPARARERRFCERLASAIRQVASLRVRRNYPYRGAADGLTTSLRREFPASAYMGIEIEVNQAIAASNDAARRREVVRTLTESIPRAY